MNRILLYLQKKGPLVLPVVLLLLGIALGQLTVRGCYYFFPDLLENWNISYQKEVIKETENVFQLFQYLFFNQCQMLLIFWLLSITILGLPYYVICILKVSFQVSFLIGSFLLFHGTKGIFLGFCNYFPSIICRLPMYYICIKYGLQLIGDIGGGTTSSLHNILWKKYGRWVMLSILLLIGAAALEAWFGHSVLAWAVKSINRK